MVARWTSRVPISTRQGSGYGKSETSSHFNDFKKSGDIPTPKLQVCFLSKKWDGTKRNEPIPDKNTRRCNPQTYGILLGWRMSEVHNPLQVAKGFGLIVSMDGCDAVSCGDKTEFFLGCYVQNVGDFQDVCFARLGGWRMIYWAETPCFTDVWGWLARWWFYKDVWLICLGKMHAVLLAVGCRITLCSTPKKLVKSLGSYHITCTYMYSSLIYIYIMYSSSICVYIYIYIHIYLFLFAHQTFIFCIYRYIFHTYEYIFHIHIGL